MFAVKVGEADGGHGVRTDSLGAVLKKDCVRRETKNYHHKITNNCGT